MLHKRTKRTLKTKKKALTQETGKKQRKDLQDLCVTFGGEQS